MFLPGKLNSKVCVDGGVILRRKEGGKWGRREGRRRLSEGKDNAHTCPVLKETWGRQRVHATDLPPTSPREAQGRRTR